VVIGVSPDSIASHEKFRAKYDLKFPLLSDGDRKVAAKYGVLKEKTVKGKKRLGIERSTFVIDEKGRILEAFRKVKVDGHADAVLDLL
jgi:peroxiredoxin Q/BCP